MNLVRDGAVQKDWVGKTAVIIATGPSLEKAQLDLVAAARAADLVRVIAINDSYLVAPWADVLYHSDVKWRAWHESGIARAWPWASFTAEEQKQALRDFGGQIVSVDPKGGHRVPGTAYLALANPNGLFPDPKGITGGGNSGHQALHIAYHAGANPILLLGYDARINGRKHAFGEHPDNSGPPTARMISDMRTLAKPLARLGVRVVNCTPGSALDCFPKEPLARCLSPTA